MTSPAFLSQPSSDATLADVHTARDLADTLAAHTGKAVGMAANMIGVSKRIIIINDEGVTTTMFNPTISAQYGDYEAEEGCLCFDGTRTTKRYRRIEVTFQDASMQVHHVTYEGWPAQIIQHEVDHCEGVLI
jgi:peptide deformylase